MITSDWRDTIKMQEITIDKKELYDLVKRAVREVIEEELSQLRLEGLPFVSDEEMRQIEKEYGKPEIKKKMGRTESIEI